MPVPCSLPRAGGVSDTEGSLVLERGSMARLHPLSWELWGGCLGSSRCLNLPGKSESSLQPHANVEPHVGYSQVSSSQILTKKWLGMEITASSVGSWGSESCTACLKLFRVTWKHTSVAISSLLLLVLLIFIKIMKAFLNAKWIRNPFKCTIFFLKVVSPK